jgi:hypothetical protein
MPKHGLFRLQIPPIHPSAFLTAIASIGILAGVRQHCTILLWTRLTAVIFVAAAQFLRADDKPEAPDGYTMVPFKSGDKTSYIKVKNQANAFSKLGSDQQKMFNRTSVFANKDFSLSANAMPGEDSDFKDKEQNTFITKRYSGDNSGSTVPNLNTKALFPTATPYNQTAAGFNKSYFTTAATGQDRAAVLGSSTTTADQNRTAVLGGPDKPEVLSANSMANKQYLGPGAQKVPDGVVIKDNIILTRMSQIPSRALTIDEVRDLINHGATPNTDIKPDEASKPLNDPDYKPEPLRDNPSPGSDDDKDDPVPPPGTMAMPRPPENAEPLPQR